MDIRNPKWVSLGQNQGVGTAAILLEGLKETALQFSACRAAFPAFLGSKPLALSSKTAA